mmetsp:Transcript_119418/g.207331  ORF Transcript_119418/g.207331 Transcript_119418/m.207331 type:complete len:200 (+) Transcript_119418:74-673(+)
MQALGKPAAKLASAMRSAMQPSNGKAKRRVMSAPAERPRGVRFHRVGSIESVHLIDEALPPQRHLSEEMDTVRYMQADAAERRVRSLRCARRDENPLLSKPVCGMLPTPDACSSCTPRSGRSSTSALPGPLANLPTPARSSRQTPRRYPSTPRHCPELLLPTCDEAAASEASPALGSTWKSSTLQSALSATASQGQPAS